MGGGEGGLLEIHCPLGPLRCRVPPPPPMLDLFIWLPLCFWRGWGWRVELGVSSNLGKDLVLFLASLGPEAKCVSSASLFGLEEGLCDFCPLPHPGHFRKLGSKSKYSLFFFSFLFLKWQELGGHGMEEGCRAPGPSSLLTLRHVCLGKDSSLDT